MAIFKEYRLSIDTMVERKGKNKPIVFSENDFNTAKLVIDVLHDEEILDLTGSTVRIAFFKGDGNRIFQDTTIVDALTGVVEVILSAQTLAFPGNVKAELVIDMPGDSAVTTTKFTIVVEDSIMGDDAIESTNEFPVIQKAIDAGEILSEITDLQTIVNNTVNVNNLKTEVETARGTEPNLSAKLGIFTAQLEGTARYEQVDYVEILRRYANFEKMQIKKTSTANAFEISVYDKSQHVTFEFLYNNDDYMTQSRIWQGTFSTVLGAYLSKFYGDTTRTGTWVDSTASIVGYTAQVGATFSLTVDVEKDGDNIGALFNTTDRGGIWKLTLDNNPATDISISVWNATAVKKDFNLFNGVTKGTHTVKGEFMGDDPLHVPSTGAGTARGWVNSLNAAMIKVTREFINPNKDVILTEPSNKEFAFNIKPQGGTTQNFVPFHGVATAFNAEPTKFKDGLKIIDVVSMAVGDIKELEGFTVEQHIYGRNPESASTNLIEIWTRQTINKEGKLSIDGKMKVLQPITINNSYVIMGVGKGNLFDLVVSSFGNSYINNPSLYGTNTPMVEERDWNKSYVYLSSTNKNVAIGMRFNNIRETLRQGETGKDIDGSTMTYLNTRDDAILKIYSRLWNSADVQAGYVMRFSGDYIFATGQNFYDVLAI